MANRIITPDEMVKSIIKASENSVERNYPALSRGSEEFKQKSMEIACGVASSIGDTPYR